MMEYSDETAGVVRERGKAVRILLKHNGNPVEIYNTKEITEDEGKDLLKKYVNYKADEDAKTPPEIALRHSTNFTLNEDHE
jgi:hypothetical protein